MGSTHYIHVSDSLAHNRPKLKYLPPVVVERSSAQYVLATDANVFFKT